jgi:hypothetical protein
MNNIDVNKKHHVRSVVHNPVFNYTTISHCYNQSDNRRYCDFLTHIHAHTLAHTHVAADKRKQPGAEIERQSTKAKLKAERQTNIQTRQDEQRETETPDKQTDRETFN